MTLTLDVLRAVCPHTKAERLEIFLEPLAAAMDEFAIITPARQAAFLAQIAHESADFLYVRELASGEAYEGNAHLGNTEAGDGPRFKGRGLVQITGRKNYGLCAEALGLDLLEQPELLEEPINACRSAGWFWTVGAGLNLSKRALERCGYGCNLNDLADRNDFETITLAVNGGVNGRLDRMAHWERAKAALQAEAA